VRRRNFSEVKVIDAAHLRSLDWNSPAYFRLMDQEAFDYTHARGEFDEEYFLEVTNVGDKGKFYHNQLC
jgi:hypothetical protein